MFKAAAATRRHWTQRLAHSNKAAASQPSSQKPLVSCVRTCAAHRYTCAAPDDGSGGAATHSQQGNIGLLVERLAWCVVTAPISGRINSLSEQQSLSSSDGSRDERAVLEEEDKHSLERPGKDDAALNSLLLLDLSALYRHPFVCVCASEKDCRVATMMMMTERKR